MGNESSREPSPEAEESSSSITRLKERLHLHGLRRHLHLRHSQRSGSSSALRKLLHADHFAGIALLTLRRVCRFFLVVVFGSFIVNFLVSIFFCSGEKIVKNEGSIGCRFGCFV